MSLRTYWSGWLFALICWVALNSSYGQVTSNFSIDADGWGTLVVSSGLPAVLANYHAAGGNPGGNISIDITNPTTPYYFYADRYFDAPAKFLANKSSSYNQNLTFDLQQSLNGTDASTAEVILTGGGISVFFPVSSFPNTSSWTSYSVVIKETAGWKTGSLAGTATTMMEMKQVLSNLTSLRIRAQYFPTFPAGTYSCRLDNVVLNQSAIPTAPVITSFTPSNGVAGTTVTITGNNFNTTTAQNLVFFNGIKGSVVSATSTQLTVTSPSRTAFGPISVTNLANGTQTTSGLNFNPLFDNNKDFGARVIPSTFALKADFGATTAASLSIGDLDGDGWTDVVTSSNNAGSFSVSAYRNLSQTGSINASSFASPITLSIPNSATAGVAQRVGRTFIDDMDGDGKPDVVVNVGYVCCGGNWDNSFVIYLNQSISGSLSFSSGSVFQFASVNNNNEAIAVADMDGDGRPELMGAINNSACQLGIAQNLSTPGNLDFAAFQNLALGQTFGNDISFGDLTGDGKPEIILEAYLGGAIYIYENTSTAGTISLNTPFQISSISTINIEVADLDSDGKNDILFKDGANPSYIHLKKNNHTAGALSAADFSTDILIGSIYPTGGSSSQNVGVADVNGDNKVDIIGNDGSKVIVYQNNYSGGAISASSFVPGIAFEGDSNSSNWFVFCADVDGDNKPEIIIQPQSNINFRVYRNETFPAPRIDLLSPTSGPWATNVSLTGDHFSTGIGFPPNFGRLGMTSTPILPATNTSASSVVPPGGITDRFSMTEHGLTGYSQPFNVLFSTKRIINSTSFTGIDFTLSNNGGLGLAVADFDNDGKPDVVVDDNSTGLIFQNTQAIAGAPITTSSLTKLGTTLANSLRLTSGDFDGDGKIDVATSSNLLYQNNSTTQPSFAASVSSNMGGSNMILGNHDFNLDGKPELVSVNGGSLVYVFENLTRNGSFTPAPFPSFSGNGSLAALQITLSGNAARGTAADFDGDGFDDLAIGVTSTTSSLTVYPNAGLKLPITASQFASPLTFTSNTTPTQIAAADFDGDGKQDVVLGYNIGTTLSIFKNQSSVGAISFAGKQDITISAGISAMAAQDLDGDGLPEIITTNFIGGSGSFSVFQNTSSGSISFASPITFSLASGRNPSDLAVADVNFDKLPDLIVRGTGSTTNFLTVFQNNIAFPPPYNNKIFYSRADGTTWVTSGDGSADQFIVNGFWPRLSPDGRYLLYHKGTTVTNLQVNYYTLDLVFGIETLVFTSNDYTVGNCWSVDGSKIFYDYSCDIQTMNRDGSGITVIDNAGGCYDDAPDLRFSDGLLVIQNQSNGLLTMKSDGTSRIAIPNTLTGDVFARWSPDGQWITFTRTNVSPSVQYKIKPDGSSLTALTAVAPGETLGGFQGGGGVWLNDGSGIIIYGKIDCQWGLFKIPANGSKVMQRLQVNFSSSYADEVGSIIGTPPLAFSPLYTDPAISSFSPLIGSVGNTVTLTGTNFDPTPANNIVKFNGIAAVVTASTSTSITTTVPAGATTGTITVNTAACNTGTTSSPFTVGIPATITLSTQPSSSAVCNDLTTQFICTASGTTNIAYQWQYSFDGIAPYADITNTGGYSNVSTSAVSVNTTGSFGAGFYRCKVGGDFASTAFSNAVSLTVNTIPSAPVASNANNCGPGSVTLSASGGSNGQYIWYDVNGIISGQNNSSYTTPTVSVTSTYSVAINNGTCTSANTNITVTINAVPTAPTTTGANSCGLGSVTLSASGGNNGNYVWYDVNGLVPGQSNSTYTTPTISTTTQYSVAITNGPCTSVQTNVTATINAVPSAPTTMGATACIGSTFSLSASGGTNGQYVWYTTASGGSSIPGEVNNIYITPALTSNTTYYVSINNGTCESTRTPVIATVNTSGCSIPVITPTTVSVQVGGVVTLNLVPLIMTANNNLDLSSITVTKQPASGAIALVANGILTVNYNGITFSGTEQITVSACDIDGNCASQIVTIEVAGDVIVYNGISPGGKNPTFIVEYINLLPETKDNTVYIFDRWENQVWHGSNYDNASVVFTGVSDGGSELPSGVYFYKIIFASGKKTLTGFISLRR